MKYHKIYELHCTSNYRQKVNNEVENIAFNTESVECLKRTNFRGTSEN